MPLSKLYIDQHVADFPTVESIKARVKIPSIVVQDAQSVYEIVSKDKDPVQKGKEILFLTRNMGSFIKNCPGTRHYTCCGYQILNIGSFCNMDCSYCILQAYFHPPVLQYYVNHHDMLKEIDHVFSKKTTCRLGTGEFTDSMIWELWTDLSQTLIPKFSEQNHAVLELKTKTTAIEGIKKLTHNKRTILSWSLNTETIIKSEERGTASLSARLKAAAKCELWGYPIGFHFDPLVLYNGCEEEYRSVVKKIFSHVSSENVVWISLGSFRFIPSLKHIIQKRFPESHIIYGEFIPGLDGKMRYFKPLRIDLYQQIYSIIKEIAPDVLVYFCMEDDEVWHKVFGFIPSERGGLSNMLDESAVKHCNLASKV